MNEAQFEVIVQENRKQSEYLRQTRNWVRFAGVVFIILPIIGGILYFFLMVGLVVGS